eukprot:gene7551-biopygen5140
MISRHRRAPRRDTAATSPSPNVSTKRWRACQQAGAQLPRTRRLLEIAGVGEANVEHGGAGQLGESREAPSAPHKLPAQFVP